MTKNATIWRPDSGTGELNNDNEDVERTTEAGVTRVTEAGTTRVLEDSLYVPKGTNVWTRSDS